MLYFLAGNRIIQITSEHASATVGKKRGRGKLEPAIPGMTIEIPKSISGDISQSDSESDHNIASKSAFPLMIVVRFTCVYKQKWPKQL